MLDLKTQLSDYLDHVVQRLEVEDILEERVGSEPVQPVQPRFVRRSISRWVYGVAAAVVIAVLIGGVAWLTRGGSEQDVINQPTLTTVVNETTLTTAPAPTTTLASDSTVAPSTTLVPELASPAAETLEMLDVALEQDELHDFWGFPVRAPLEYVYSYLTGMAQSAGWPEPVFDTSSLGVELVLTEVVPDAFLRSNNSGDGFLSPDSTVGGIPMTPFVAGAQLEGTTVSAVFTIVLAFDDGVVNVQWRLLSDRAGSQSGPPLDDPNAPHIILVHGADRGPDLPVIIGGLPPDASVIATTFRDGTKVWQRPVSGIAIFDDPDRHCVGSVPQECEGEYTVLNADGDEILRIVFGADDSHTDGFRVDTP